MENNLESILSRVSSDPDLIKKIGEIARSGGDDSIGEVMALISPLVSGESNENPDITEKNDATVNKAASSIGKSISKNKALLVALKPYLSKERCEMIDHVVKLSQIADVIKLI